MKYQGFKTRAWIYLGLLLVALDWIAFNGIFSGKTNLTGEYITIAISVIVFAILVYIFIKQDRNKSEDKS
ncbi:MAG: hypothetical protein ABIG32_02650 [Candidatus Uhrbacteria bacterium]|nr:hypothetical protein [Patescibacteria group bacterium]MBU1906797.1 hypothetical protein [Patescibacteria group bacterium]